MKRLASSIHTIHRPLARSQRIPIPSASKEAHGTVPTDTDREELADLSSEDEIENDFELNNDNITTTGEDHMQNLTLPKEQRPVLSPHERAGSMATIRLHRRTRLADKLRQVFELDDISEVLAGSLSWSPNPN